MIIIIGDILEIACIDTELSVILNVSANIKYLLKVLKVQVKSIFADFFNQNYKFFLKKQVFMKCLEIFFDFYQKNLFLTSFLILFLYSLPIHSQIKERMETKLHQRHAYKVPIDDFIRRHVISIESRINNFVGTHDHRHKK